MDKGCFCKGSPGVTYVSIRGLTVGLAGLPEIFQQWLDSGKTPESLGDQEILQAFKERNYISTAAEKEYADALRSLYAAKSRNRPLKEGYRP